MNDTFQREARLPPPDGHAGRLSLDAQTAVDLMTPHVVSVPASATIQEAVALLADRNLGAVPVTDETGMPVGVLSRSDIVSHDCVEYGHLQPELDGPMGDGLLQRLKQRWPNAFRVEGRKAERVWEIMTPVVFSIAPEVPAEVVVEAMLKLGVHRLFVTGRGGELLGVISAIDIVRHLHRPRRDTLRPAAGV